MGLTDALSVAGSSTSYTTNTEKAIIEIIDLRDRDVKLDDSVKIVGKGASIGSFTGSAGAGSFIGSGIIADVVGKISGVKGNTLKASYIEELASNRKLFTVQFNPSSVSFSGHAGGMVALLDYNSRKNEGASYKPANTTISMSVNLLFDSMDPQDAFMDDKANLSMTNIGKGVAKAALTVTGNKKTSVQKEVEGFIGALRNRDTRLVTFHWGDFNYSGVLNRISAEYTMFNPVGEPVRANVGITIMCADAELWPNSLGVWQQRYKESFEGGSESFKDKAQSIGSLINL